MDEYTSSGTTGRTVTVGNGAESGLGHEPHRADDTAVARSSVVMAAGTAVSRVLGFVRVAVLAQLIGATGGSANAFSVANTIPNMLYLLIAGGVLNAVLVPQVVKATRSADGGAEYLNKLITLAVAVMAVVSALIVLAAPVLVRLLTLEADPDQRALAIGFAVWCLPQVFFYALYTLLGQILNAKGRFGAYMWAPVVNNVVGLAGLSAFWFAFGAVASSGAATAPASWTPAQVAVLAGTSTLGVVVQALVLLVPLRRAGVRLRPRWGVRGMGLRSAGKLAGWTFAALLLSQTSALVVANVGSSVQDSRAAGNAIWASAFLVLMLPHSLVTVSLVTALFTRMSAAAARGDAAGLRHDISSGLRVIAVASVLATAAMVVLGDAAGVVLAGGDVEQGRVLGRVIAVIALALVPFSAIHLLQRGFYALEDARTPFLVHLLTTAIWITCSLLTFLVVEQDRIVGVAAGLVISQWVGAMTAGVLLHRRLGSIDGARVCRTHVRLLLAGSIAAAGGGLVVTRLDALLVRGYAGAALTGVLVGGVVILLYAAGLRTLHVDEASPLLRRVLGRSRRGRRRARGART